MVTVEKMKKYLKMTGYDVKFVGDLNVSVEGFCSLEMPRSCRITWIKNVVPGVLDGFKDCQNIIVVAKEPVKVQQGMCFIITEKPKNVFFDILKEFWGIHNTYGIAESAVVETEHIGQNVCIGQNCYIGKEVFIGDGSVIEHNVSIYHKVVIGKNCIIHSGSVIGADGFGYYIDLNGQPEKVEHFGGVYIGDDVEIGANACIDRGTIDDTVIESHTKIDNLVHIAHNVKIGKSSMIVAGAVICGSAKLGQKSYIAPGGIVKNQLKIGDNAFIGMGAVVSHSVHANMVAVGVPAKEIREVRKEDK